MLGLELDRNLPHLSRYVFPWVPSQLVGDERSVDIITRLKINPLSFYNFTTFDFDFVKTRKSLLWLKKAWICGNYVKYLESRLTDALVLLCYLYLFDYLDDLNYRHYLDHLHYLDYLDYLEAIVSLVSLTLLDLLNI